jgi:hypothetical protein
LLGLDNGVARRWLHSGAWVAALMAGHRAGSRAKGRTVPFIGKGGGGGQAGGEFSSEDGCWGGAHGHGSSAGHGSRRGERRGGLGACRALVAPERSGFVKQGALGAGLARVRPSGRDRWRRQRTAPPWARCRKEQR